MHTKVCPKCENEKETTGFYKDRAGRCKRCISDDVKKYYVLNRQNILSAKRKHYRENRRVVERNHYKTDDERRLAGVRAVTKWIRRNPEKKRAHLVVGYKIKKGEMEPEPCKICGSENDLNAHHENYDLPLEVTWLCRSCHFLWHSLLKGWDERIKSTTQPKRQEA